MRKVFSFEGELTQNPPVQVGNIVYVPPMDGGNQIFVLGEVRTPGAYSVEPGREVRLVELIARAGGTTPTADLAGVRIYARGDVKDYESAPIGTEGFLFEGELMQNPVVHVGNIVYIPPVSSFPITIMGMVSRPGSYEMPAGNRLLDALAVAGGLSAQADATNLTLRRIGDDGSVQSVRIDLLKVMTGESIDGNVLLQRGDLIFAQPTIQVAVAGEVRSNGVFQLRSGSRVTDAILAAGGVTQEAALGRITISRNDGDNQIVIPVDYAGILAGTADNPRVQDGDIINVPHEVQIVYVIGHVASPGAYRITAESRLVDVIYAAGGPTVDGDMRSITIYDGPTTIASQGVRVRETVETASHSNVRSVFVGRLEENPPVFAGQTVYVPGLTMDIFVLGASTGPEYTMCLRAAVSLTSSSLGGPDGRGNWRNVQILRSADPDAPAERVDVEALLITPGTGKNVEIHPGDVVYVPPNEAMVSVVGEVARPGTYTLSGDAKVVDAVAAAGGAARAAALERVNVLQGSEGYQPVEVRLGTNDEFSLEGLEDSLRVSDGDVIVVPRSHRITWEQVISILTGVKLIKDVFGF